MALRWAICFTIMPLAKPNRTLVDFFPFFQFSFSCVRTVVTASQQIISFCSSITEFIHIYKAKNKKKGNETKRRLHTEKLTTRFFVFYNYTKWVFEKSWRGWGRIRKHQILCDDDDAIPLFVLCLYVCTCVCFSVCVRVWWAHRLRSRLRFGARSTTRNEIVFQLAQSRLHNQMTIFELVCTAFS